jgi:[protein-PII] uridylyltransferase
MTQAQATPPSNPPFRANSTSLGSEIKIYLERHDERVKQLIAAGDVRAGAEASGQWARAFDGLLCALFCSIRSSVGDERTWSNLSLGAVGSYGRGNFSYRSDLDVRILCDKPKKAVEISEAILYPLWDAGLQIGHQVVTVSDTLALAKKDLPTATTLFDWRHIAGNPAMAKKLRERAFETIFAGARVGSFLEELHTQAESRAERFGDSVYLLEPDVKNGQGGQRDLDIILWTAQARWRVQSLKELLSIGILVPTEFEQLEEARQFLARVRNILHFLSPRRTDRLGFESQEATAFIMGYGKGGAGCESMMSDYYRHARAISNAREALLARAAPVVRSKTKEERVAEGIVMRDGAIAIEDLEQLSVSPVLALRAYWEVVTRNLKIELRSRDAIAQAMMDEGICERLRVDTEAATLFRRLSRKTRKVNLKRNSTLSEFHDVGILLAMIPEFRPVVGRVHHDIYHVYTVDAHSIAAVDRLRALARGDLSDEHPIATRLASDIARPQVLFMAALLHDIGKDEGGRDHSDRGAEICRPIMVRLGVQEHDIVEIEHLVRKHLRMYHVASRRDIDDPQTIENFRAELHGPEGLNELYLLTLCDVSTTSPTALTTWKARMMLELYLRTRHSFEGLPPRTEERAQKLRAATIELCPSEENEFLHAFLEGVQDRYIYANEPLNIVTHARVAAASESEEFVVEMIGARLPYIEIAVIADDRPGALADITACFAAARVRVISAQLYSWVDRRGRARVLDIFWVHGATEQGAISRQLSRVRNDLARVLAGTSDAASVMKLKIVSTLENRPVPSVLVRVHFDNRSSSEYTVIEVLGEDRLGLLHSLATVLKDAGLQVAVAKINTEGNGAADVFYVADQHGKKLVDEERLAQLEVELRAAIFA